LVRNAAKINYLPKIFARLNHTMGLLLLVCFLFLASLFIRLEDVFIWQIRLVSVVIEVGVFFFSLAVYKFICVWREFSSFTSNM
jgi:hypothetical protein